MTQETKHTPTPWVLSRDVKYSIDKYDGSGQIKKHILLVSCYATTPAEQEENEANAEFIVRACNSHHALVEALKSSRDCVSALHERVRGSIEYGAPAEYFKRDLDKIDQALKQAGAE